MLLLNLSNINGIFIVSGHCVVLGFCRCRGGFVHFGVFIGLELLLGAGYGIWMVR